MIAETQRNYVASWIDGRKQKVVVYERDIATGERTLREVKPPHYFYVPDDEGEYESIFGHKLTKLSFENKWQHADALKRFPLKFESDIRPQERVLMDMYYGKPTPPVNYVFFDIEVNYRQLPRDDKDREEKWYGFAGPLNPYAPISAVTVYQSWTKSFITIAVCPEGVDREKFVLPTEHEMRSEFKFNASPEIYLVANELELLECFLDTIQEADIISGWNSEFYDFPYICLRIEKLMGVGSLQALELPGGPELRVVKRDRYGSEEPTYVMSGRSHLDYLRLFEKFTFEGRSSYALANIAYEELDVPKLDFEGTLEELYNGTHYPNIALKDPERYGKPGLANQLHTKQIDREIVKLELKTNPSRQLQEKFELLDTECKHLSFKLYVLYNIRDVEVIKLLDEKFKFIALTNQMAHENTVPFSAIMGTVKYVETGITNHAHYVLKKIVHDKSISQHDKVEGAIVLSPKVGLHEWIGSVDINSLYPNTIRSLNISPEKIIGQFDNVEDEMDWLAIRLGSPDVFCTLRYENGVEQTLSAAEWRELFKKHQWAVSAYGTVFDQGNGRGVVPDILGFWYDERKRLQAEKKKWTKILKEMDGKEDSAEYLEAKRQEDHFDLLQLTKKIAMNSLYGALLNAAFRFGDVRMGASVTATGRRITKHMMETIGQLLTGEHFEVEKSRKIVNGELSIIYTCKSPAIIYGDTDSCYYKTFANNKEDAILIADGAAQEVNASFPAFMRDAFLCQPGFDNLIKAGREIVGRRGLFQAKKKYMIKVIDLEGFAVDKMKSQGSEIKKADTPKIIQAFLKKTVDMILDGEKYEAIVEFVNSQRREILKKDENVFLLGVAKQINNVEAMAALNETYKTTPKPKGFTIPGHVRAAINYNDLISVFDNGAKPIRSGDKGLIYYVKPNQYGMKAIAFPSELARFPAWFVENFKVDIKLTEEKMFDAKLGTVFAAIGKEVPTLQSAHIAKIVEFF